MRQTCSVTHKRDEPCTKTPSTSSSYWEQCSMLPSSLLPASTPPSGTPPDCRHFVVVFPVPSVPPQFFASHRHTTCIYMIRKFDNSHKSRSNICFEPTIYMYIYLNTEYYPYPDTDIVYIYHNKNADHCPLLFNGRLSGCVWNLLNYMSFRLYAARLRCVMCLHVFKCVIYWRAT